MPRHARGNFGQILRRATPSTHNATGPVLSQFVSLSPFLAVYRAAVPAYLRLMSSPELARLERLIAKVKRARARYQWLVARLDRERRRAIAAG